MTRGLTWSAVAFIALAVAVVLGLVYLTGRTIRRKEGGVKAATTGLLAILVAALSYLMLGGMWGIGGDHGLSKTMSSVAVWSLLGVGAFVALWLVALTIRSIVKREGAWTIAGNVLLTLIIVWIVGGLTLSMFAQGVPRSEEGFVSNRFRHTLSALSQYAGDHDGFLPSAQDQRAFLTALSPYLDGGRTGKQRELPPLRAIFFNSALVGKNLERIENPAQVPLLYDFVSLHKGTRLVMFADGQLRDVPISEWYTLTPKVGDDAFIIEN